jgi:signal transduction histidine kinase
LFDDEGKIRTRAVVGDQEIVKRMSNEPERQELVRRGRWMLGNRRPLAVRDIALYFDYPTRGVKAGLHGFIGAPLFSRDRKPLGIIYVMTRSPREFSPHDLNLIGQYANGAAVAIENAGLLKKSENNIYQLRALREIDQAITSTLDLDKILNVLLEKIELVLPYAAATIRLINRETGRLEPVACRNLDPKEWKATQRSHGRGLANAVFEARTPTIVRNVQADPRVLDTEFYRRNQLVSYLGVPLIAEGEILGVLNFYTKENHEFSNEEVEFLSTLAGQAAVAIHHSQLYERTRAREAQLEETNRMLSALHEVAAIAGETPDLDRVLRVAIEKITETFRFDATRFHIYDERTDEIVLRASFANDPDRFTAAHSFRRKEGIVGKVVESGKAMIFEDTRTDPLYRQASRTKVSDRFGYRFFGVFPIQGKRKNLGALGCVGKAPRKLNLREIQLLEAIADRVAVAIENSELYEQLKHKVKELQHKTAELEKANKAKSEFLSVMSHELRTPLNVIMGYARVVKEGMLGGITSEQEKALDKAINSSADLLHMVAGILDATSIEAGAVNVESYAVSMEDFLDSLRSNYDVPFGKELTLHWDYPSDLPPIQTDSEKLKHILQNLINNAIKFTDKGYVTLSARHIPEAGTLEFKVSDTGVGISKESLPVIFEMFRQVDGSASRPYGGVGLGLFIVMKLTELLGGKVEAESVVGQGSTFTVTIPTILPRPAAPSDEKPAVEVD